MTLQNTTTNPSNNGSEDNGGGFVDEHKDNELWGSIRARHEKNNTQARSNRDWIDQAGLEPRAPVAQT
jgi:hypothetical protein